TPSGSLTKSVAPASASGDGRCRRRNSAPLRETVKTTALKRPDGDGTVASTSLPQGSNDPQPVAARESSATASIEGEPLRAITPSSCHWRASRRTPSDRQRLRLAGPQVQRPRRDQVRPWLVVLRQHERPRGLDAAARSGRD